MKNLIPHALTSRDALLTRLACIFLFPFLAFAAEKGTVEGMLRDREGRPVTSKPDASTGNYVLMQIETVARKTYDNNIIIPVIGKSAVGVVGIQFPPSTLPLWFDVPTRHLPQKDGRYRFSASTKFTEFVLLLVFRHKSGFLADEVLGDVYFPVTIGPGEKVEKNLLIQFPHSVTLATP